MGMGLLPSLFLNRFFGSVVIKMMRVDRAEIDGSSEIKELSPLEQALM